MAGKWTQIEDIFKGAMFHSLKRSRVKIWIFKGQFVLGFRGFKESTFRRETIRISVWRFFGVGRRSCQKQHVRSSLQLSNSSDFIPNKNSPPIADICQPRFSSPAIRKNNGVQKAMIGHEHQTTDTQHGRTQNACIYTITYEIYVYIYNVYIYIYTFPSVVFSCMCVPCFLFRTLCFLRVSGHLDM